MKKLKRLFKPHPDHENNHAKQNEQVLHVQSNILPKQSCQNSTQNTKLTQQCKNCVQNSLLIAKYTDLIKLLKIKINKLEKQLHLKQSSRPNDLIDDFEDFKMELDSASLQTLKQRTQKVLNPFKDINMNFDSETADNHIAFDKTVKKSQNVQIKKHVKSFKKFVSELKILDQDFQNKKENITRTQRHIEKAQSRIIINKKNSDEFGKSISFVKLMQKSQISLKSSKDFVLNSYSGDSGLSSIKGLCLQSQFIQNNNSAFLKQQSKRSLYQKQLNDISTKCQVLQKRIMFLSQTVLDLKSFLLHVRHSIYQFVKMTDINHLKSKESQSYYMLGIIIKIFEYSQDELEEMIRKKKQVNTQSKIKSLLYSTLGR